jgi:hypothetical protein
MGEKGARPAIPHALAIALDHEAVAVMLDLMNPLRAYRRLQPAWLGTVR